MKRVRFAAAFALVFLMPILTFVPPVQGVQQAGLDPGGDAQEVNHDYQGYLYVSEASVGKIWEITASDGSYKTYTLGHQVRDAQLDNWNRIWWVSDSDSFGYVTPGTPREYRWILSADAPYFLHTLAPDGDGGVWLGESDFPGRLFHFSPSDGNLCQYDLPEGAGINDMVYQSGILWLSDWKLARLYHIYPDAGGISYIYWQADFNSGAWGIAFDGKYLWWADYYGFNRLGRLDPDKNEATYYQLPFGIGPRMVELVGDQVWYTGAFGQVGVLNPALAESYNVYLDWVSDVITESCKTLVMSGSNSVQYGTGTLGWDDSPVLDVYNSTGWKIYDLPGASPFGLSAVGGSIYASDSGRDLLLRFDTNTYLYFPILRMK